MRKTTLTLAALLIAGSWATTQAQETPEPQPRESEQRAEARVPPEARTTPERRGGESGLNEELLTGRFTLAGSKERSEAQINEAISRAVADMSFLTRGIAADRLREKNPVRESVQTEVSGDRIAITYGDARYESRSGNWETVVATGEEVELLQTASGDAIYQTFRAEDGEKTTVYRFSPDGERLTLDITLTSPRLPAPLRYSLRYERAGGQQPVASR